MFTLEQIENARNLATQDFNNSTANRLAGHLLKRFLNLNLIDSYELHEVNKKMIQMAQLLKKIQTEMFCED